MASIPQLFNQAAASAQSKLPTTSVPTPTQSPPAPTALPVPQQPIAGANAQQQAQQQTLLPGTTPAPGQPAAKVNQSLILQYAMALAQSLARVIPGLGKLIGGSAGQTSAPVESAKLAAFSKGFVQLADKLGTLLSPGKMAHRGERNLSEAERMRQEGEERLANARDLREKSKGETDPHVLAQMLREAREQEKRGSELQDKAGRRGTIGSLQSGFGQIGQSIGNAGNQSETAVAGNVMSGVGELAGTIPIIGDMLKAFIELDATILRTLDHLQEWGNSLHQANMRFAEFSASMAQVQAKQMQRDIQLSRERGDRRSESADQLAEAKSRLDRQLAVIQDHLGNIYNSIATQVLDVSTGILVILQTWFTWDKNKDNAKSGAGIMPGLVEEMAEVGRAAFRRKYGKPPRFSEYEE